MPFYFVLQNPLVLSGVICSLKESTESNVLRYELFLQTQKKQPSEKMLTMIEICKHRQSGKVKRENEFQYHSQTYNLK